MKEMKDIIINISYKDSMLTNNDIMKFKNRIKIFIKQIQCLFCPQGKQFVQYFKFPFFRNNLRN